MTDINFDEINRELQESEQPKPNNNTINLTLEQIRELLNPNKQQQQQTVQSISVETEQPEGKPKKEKKPMSEKKRLAVEKMKEGRKRQLEQQRQMKQNNQLNFQQSYQQPTQVDVSNPPYVPPNNNPQMNYLAPEQIYQQYQQQQPRGQVYDYSVPPPQPTPQPVYQNPQQDMYQQRHPQVSKFPSKPKTENVFDQLGFQYFDSKSSKPPSTSKPQSKTKAKGGPINPFEFFR